MASTKKNIKRTRIGTEDSVPQIIASLKQLKNETSDKENEFVHKSFIISLILNVTIWPIILLKSNTPVDAEFIIMSVIGFILAVGIPVVALSIIYGIIHNDNSKLEQLLNKYNMKHRYWPVLNQLDESTKITTIINYLKAIHKTFDTYTLYELDKHLDMDEPIYGKIAHEAVIVEHNHKWYLVAIGRENAVWIYDIDRETGIVSTKPKQNEII